MDKLSKFLVEILVSLCAAPQVNGRRGTLMYHVVNPNTTSWPALGPGILASYPTCFNTRAVLFDECIEALNQSADEFVDLEKIPAIKLLDFYRGAARAEKEPLMLTSRKAGKASETLQRVRAVNKDWVRNWMRQWGIQMG